MVHHRQSLSFRFKAGDDLLRIHTWLDDLQCDTTADWLGLLRDVDNSHSPFADLFQQLVRADQSANLLGWRLINCGNDFCSGPLQESASVFVELEQLFD